jgi:hypothetical protein
MPDAAVECAPRTGLPGGIRSCQVDSAQLTWSLRPNPGPKTRRPEDPKTGGQEGRKAGGQEGPAEGGHGPPTNSDGLRLVTMGMRLVGATMQSIQDTGRSPLVTAAGPIKVGQAWSAGAARSARSNGSGGAGTSGQPGQAIT